MKPQKSNYYIVLVYRLAIVMLLFTICRFVFYFLNRTMFPGITLNDWGGILKGGLVFDIAAMFYFNLLFVLLATVPIPFSWRVSKRYQIVIKWVFLLTNGLAIMLNCIDIIYYRFTLRRTTGAVFREFANETNGSVLAGNFLIDYWYVVVIFIVLVALMVWLYKSVSIKILNKQIRPLRYYLIAVLIFLLSIVLAIGGVRGGYKYSTRPITISNAGAYVKRPNEIYLVLNTPFTLVRAWGIQGLKRINYYSEAEVEKIYSPLHYPNDTTAMQKKNVVIIILESFGKEAVGFYNKELDNGTYKGFTPFLDSIASVSKVYWNSFANGRKSIDAMPSVLTSIPSGVDPFILTPYVTDSIQSLAHILSNEGYHTSFFHGAPNGSMGLLAFSKMMGIQNYFGKDEYNNDKDFDGVWGIWDEPFMQFFQKQLSSFQQPFFSTFFSVSSHHPFKVPEQYKNSFKKGPLDVLQCIGYTDMALRKFFNAAQNNGWFNNTLFVITADHATVSYHKEYQNMWGDYAIPIILFAPGDKNLKGVDKGIIQQLDIMPSVLGYLHYNKPYFAFGENVFDRKDDGFAFVYSSGYRWFYDNHILYFDGEKSDILSVYKPSDSKEQNVMLEKPELAKKMETRLKAFVQQYHNRLIDNKLTVK